MRRRRMNFNDSESLQADVMRFMAIIAFCLIAILALVRDIDRDYVSPVETPVVPDPPASQDSQISEEVPIPEVTVVAELVEPDPDPVRTATLEPRIEPSETPEPVAPEPVIIASAAVEPIERELAMTEPTVPPPPKVLAPAEPVPVVAKHTKAKDIPEETRPASTTEIDVEAGEEEDSLSLRFASDSDFLRLISKGTVDVYVFNARDTLRLGKDYRFAAVEPPTQVYELMPETIPRAIVRSLGSPATESYTWGVSIPPRMAREIAAYAARESSGQLLIDRFGEVRHVN